MDSVHSQILDILNRLWLGECKELALVLHATRLVYREVTMVHLIDDVIGESH